MKQRLKSASDNRLLTSAGLCAALVLCSACTTATPPPTVALNAARDAIATAEESGARQHADAELDEAQQKLTLAEESVRSEQMVAADRLAKEAMVSAQLASARSESARALEINRELRRGIDALAEELRRQGGQQ